MANTRMPRLVFVVKVLIAHASEDSFAQQSMADASDEALYLQMQSKLQKIISSKATYITGDKGVDACPHGYAAISEPSECKAASCELGYTYEPQQNAKIGESNSVCNYCGGCSPKTTRVDDQHGKKANWICKTLSCESRTCGQSTCQGIADIGISCGKVAHFCDFCLDCCIADAPTEAPITTTTTTTAPPLKWVVEYNKFPSNTPSNDFWRDCNRPTDQPQWQFIDCVSTPMELSDMLGKYQDLTSLKESLSNLFWPGYEVYFYGVDESTDSPVNRGVVDLYWSRRQETWSRPSEDSCVDHMSCNHRFVPFPYKSNIPLWQNSTLDLRDSFWLDWQFMVPYTNELLFSVGVPPYARMVWSMSSLPSSSISTFSACGAGDTCSNVSVDLIYAGAFYGVELLWQHYSQVLRLYLNGNLVAKLAVSAPTGFGQSNAHIGISHGVVSNLGYRGVDTSNFPPYFSSLSYQESTIWRNCSSDPTLEVFKHMACESDVDAALDYLSFKSILDLIDEYGFPHEIAQQYFQVHDAQSASFVQFPQRYYVVKHVLNFAGPCTVSEGGNDVRVRYLEAGGGFCDEAPCEVKYLQWPYKAYEPIWEHGIIDMTKPFLLEWNMSLPEDLPINSEYVFFDGGITVSLVATSSGGSDLMFLVKMSTCAYADNCTTHVSLADKKLKAGSTVAFHLVSLASYRNEVILSFFDHGQVFDRFSIPGDDSVPGTSGLGERIVEFKPMPSGKCLWVSPLKVLMLDPHLLPTPETGTTVLLQATAHSPQATQLR